MDQLLPYFVSVYNAQKHHTIDMGQYLCKCWQTFNHCIRVKIAALARLKVGDSVRVNKFKINLWERLYAKFDHRGV